MQASVNCTYFWPSEQLNIGRFDLARYIGPVCRHCRREGMKLFLKGERCHTEKCAIEKRNFPPGQHGKDRKPKIVGYGLATSRKAEGAPLLPASGRPVPQPV